MPIWYVTRSTIRYPRKGHLHQKPSCQTLRRKLSRTITDAEAVILLIGGCQPCARCLAQYRPGQGMLFWASDDDFQKLLEDLEKMGLRSPNEPETV